MVVKIEQQKNFALKGVEMGMLGLTGGSGNGFLNWKHKDKAFWINSDEIVDFDFMVIDPATIQTGWGIYANGSFDERWDAKAGIQEPKPADIGDQAWKRAFSVKVQLSGWDKPVIWKSHAFGNVMAFDLATDCYLNQAQDDAAKLPCLKNLMVVKLHLTKLKAATHRGLNLNLLNGLIGQKNWIWMLKMISLEWIQLQQAA